MKKEIKESRKSMEAIRREEGREGGSKGGREEVKTGKNKRDVGRNGGR